MKADTKILILGTEYSVEIGDPGADADGSTDVFDKKIIIKHPSNMMQGTDDEISKAARFAEVIRHEVIHAFFYESGLLQKCFDEELVDWFMMQFEKIRIAINETMYGLYEDESEVTRE